MIDPHLHKLLEDMGLSEHEAKVYLASLSLGPSTILQLSRSADLKRTTVYSVMEDLKKKGLIAIEVRGWKRLFVGESPEKLAGILRTRQEELTKQLPKLSALYATHESQSVIKYYEGLEAVKGVYEQLLKDVQPHDPYLVFSNQDAWQQWDEKYFKNFLERRAKLPIDVRMLLQDSETAQYMKHYQQNYNCRVKVLRPETKLTTNLIVTPQRVVIHELQPRPLAIVLENKNVIQMHAEMFEVMWNSIDK